MITKKKTKQKNHHHHSHLLFITISFHYYSPIVSPLQSTAGRTGNYPIFLFIFTLDLVCLLVILDRLRDAFVPCTAITSDPGTTSTQTRSGDILLLCTILMLQKLRCLWVKLGCTFYKNYNFSPNFIQEGHSVDIDFLHPVYFLNKIQSSNLLDLNKNQKKK